MGPAARGTFKYRVYLKRQKTTREQSRKANAALRLAAKSRHLVQAARLGERRRSAYLFQVVLLDGSLPPKRVCEFHTSQTRTMFICRIAFV